MEFNLAQVFREVAHRFPEREAYVSRSVGTTYRELDERTDRFAAFLVRGRGASGGVVDAQPANWETGQLQLGVLMHNAGEYLEAVLGGLKARYVPFNINFRYEPREIAALIDDSRADCLVYQSRYADKVAAALELAAVRPRSLVEVAEDDVVSAGLGAIDYRQALSSGGPTLEEVTPSPDDRFILYTGGTTGLPKGVIWRQADAFVGWLGCRNRNRSEFASWEECEAFAYDMPRRALIAAPMMHGGGLLPALYKMMRGGTVLLPNGPTHLDPNVLFDDIVAQEADELVIIGDAFAVPMLQFLRQSPSDAAARYRSLRTILSGGTTLSRRYKQELLEFLPQVRIFESVGSSEGGPAGGSRMEQSDAASTNTEAPSRVFEPREGVCVLNQKLDGLVEAGGDAIGFLAREGRTAIGYLNDRALTEQTFPVVDGRRYLNLGDYVRVLPDGRFEFLGRPKSVINTGGEKVYAPEVEDALMSHPAVFAAVVVGYDHPRWGQQVCAVIESDAVLIDQLIADVKTHCRERLAGYKVPRIVSVVEEIPRGANSKPDLDWVAEQVATAAREAVGTQ